MTCGIYKITCSGNGKFYIGSSINIEKRWCQHKSQLKYCRHENIHLQRTYNKYGKDSFEYSIIDIVDPSLDILTIEQKYIDELKPLLNIGKRTSGGDNLTNHPNRIKIIEKIKAGVIRTFAAMEQDERKEKYGRKMEANGRWDGGRTFCECGAKISSNADTCIKCYDKNGAKNPFFGKRHSDAAKERIRKSKQGSIPPNRNAIKINGINFCSQTEASRYFKVSMGTISNWV